MLEPLSLQNYDLVPHTSQLENNGHAVKLNNVYGCVGNYSICDISIVTVSYHTVFFDLG